MEWGEASITVLKIELKQFKNFANFANFQSSKDTSRWN